MPRFRRRRFIRRRRPFRRRRILRRRSGRKKRFARSRRRQRAKSFFYGYSGARHIDIAQGAIEHRNAEPDSGTTTPVESQMGLFPWRDIQEIFEQVRTVDDLIWASNGSSLLTKNRRINLRIKCRGQQDFYVSSGNQAGAIWLEVFICRPRKQIPMAGIGAGQNVVAASVITNNLNNAFMPDYNDARGLALSADVPPRITDATSQITPTITSSQYAVTPYMVPMFTENWKVIKVLKYVIPPGGQCMFRIKTRWIYLNRESLYPLGSDGTTASNWGVFRPSFGQEVFFRVHGQPVHAPGTAEQRPVNFGSATLDIVNVKKYWYNHGVRPLPSYRMEASINQGDVSSAELPAEGQRPVAETT